jgi:5-methylcytosine-specific restriction endonuclease McrA
MPCHPARAKELLKKGRAAVFRRFPFTIILKDRADGNVQSIELKIDPGSKRTGLALVADSRRGRKVVWAAEIEHRGPIVKRALDQRREVRRKRRNRHVRYRAPRFSNRRKPDGWLPPSLRSRVENIKTWSVRLGKFTPLTEIAVEVVRFDMQILKNPDIHGIEYQQGELQGYEVREYLLEKFERTCVYCGEGDAPLQIEHVIPRSKGGSNRISNLVTACESCNKRKGTSSLDEFLKEDPDRISKIARRLEAPLRDAAAVNATRYKIGFELKSLGLSTTFWSGGLTKYNRTLQGLPKEHWIDAACIGETGRKVFVSNACTPLHIRATGHGNRQLCLMNKHGFPRSRAATSGRVLGFATGDMVVAKVPRGKNSGTHIGRIAIRASGSFNITETGGVIQGIWHKHCRIVMRKDGYFYDPRYVCASKLHPYRQLSKAEGL